MNPKPSKAADPEGLADSLCQGGAPVLKPTSHIPPWPEIPDHELITRVGRGSYGEVWLARNVMGTYRAVKIVYRAAFDHTRPFDREFNGIKKFEPLSRSHDGFIDILQVGRAEEYFYYVMELADDPATGQDIDPQRYTPKSLHSELRDRKPLPFDKCVELCLSLTHALGHLHAHGLIHRDIKPSNIIFVNGILKLADIGLVAEQSEAKSFVGTEGFIPPEGPGTVQADVYSLGKVLYEIATGKDRLEFPALPNFLGEDQSDSHLLELNSVFLKACQTEAKLRYQSANEMRQDLILLQTGKSVKRAQEIERRLTLLTRIGFIGATTTVLIAGALFYVNGLRLRAARAEQSVKQQLYVSDMILAERAANQGDLRRVEQILDQHRPTAGTPDFRGFEYFYLRHLCEGDPAVVFSQTEAPACAVAISPDGRFLATGSAYLDKMDYSGQLSLFEIQTRKKVFEIPRTDGTRSIAFSPDGKLLAVGNAASTVSLWDWRTNQRLAPLFAEAGPIAKVAFSADGGLVAALVYGPSYATTGKLIVWDLANKRQSFVHKLGGDNQGADAIHGSFAHDPGSLAFSPNGQRLAFVKRTDDFHSQVQFYDPIRGGILEQRSPLWEGTIQALAYSPDGTSLAVGGAGGTVATWAIGSAEFVLFGKHLDSVSSLAFSRDGLRLVSGSADGTLKLWDSSGRRELRQFKGHRDKVWNVAFFPDGTQIASASQDKTIRLWPVDVQEQILRASNQSLMALAFSHDGRLLAMGGQDDSVKLWDITTGQLRRSFPGLTNTVLSVAMSRDGHLLAAGTTDRLAKIWDAFTGHPLATIFAGREEVASLDFSPNGHFLALGRWGYVQIWDCALQRHCTNLNGHIGATYAHFSADDKLLVSCGFGEIPVRLWQTGSWRSIGSLMSEPSSIKAATLTPDGRTLITGSEDSSIMLWDLAARHRLGVLRESMGGVLAIAVSPDAKTLAVGGKSGAIRLWNLATQRELFELKGHQQSVTSLVFSPDGTILASASADGTIRLWKITVPLDAHKAL